MQTFEKLHILVPFHSSRFLYDFFPCVIVLVETPLHPPPFSYPPSLNPSKLFSSPILPSFVISYGREVWPPPSPDKGLPSPRSWLLFLLSVLYKYSLQWKQRKPKILYLGSKYEREHTMPIFLVTASSILFSSSPHFYLACEIFFLHFVLTSFLFSFLLSLFFLFFFLLLLQSRHLVYVCLNNLSCFNFGTWYTSLILSISFRFSSILLFRHVPTMFWFHQFLL